MDNNSKNLDPQKWGEVSLTINLKDFVKKKNLPKEIHNSLIIGEAIDWEFPASSYKSRFDRVRFQNVNFNNKDFKDCLFDDCEFTNCKITFASIVSSTFRNCSFFETPFKDEAVHDCLFRNCFFKKASFIGSMIRNSTIENCEFISCETSNKVFDACILKENQFSNTKLDFRAIRDNFGLSYAQINSDYIREDRSYPADKIFDINLNESKLKKLGLDAIDLWKLNYYKRGDLIFYGEIMDNAFNMKFWLQNIQTPNNFVRFLEGFSEFLVHEYEQNRCLYYLVVRLHALTYQLFQQINSNIGFESISQAVAGIHIRTGRIMFEIDHEFLNGPLNQTQRLRIRTSDEYDEHEITEVIDQIHKSTNSFSYSIIQRNSPIDLLFQTETVNATITILSYFILSKTKFEIEKIISVSSKKTSSDNIALKKSVFALNFGLADDKNSKEVFSMSSSLAGNYSITICFMIGTSVLKKMRKILHDIISEQTG